MFQKLLASKHYRLRDSKSRPRLGRAKDLVWSPTKLKKKIINKPRLNQEPRQAPGRAVNKPKVKHKPRSAHGRAVKNKPLAELEPRTPTAARLIIKCANIPLSLGFPRSFDHNGFCRVNFHFFDTNLCYKS